MDFQGCGLGASTSLEVSITQYNANTFQDDHLLVQSWYLINGITVRACYNASDYNIIFF